MHNPRATSDVQDIHAVQCSFSSPLRGDHERSRTSTYDLDTRYSTNRVVENLDRELAPSASSDTLPRLKTRDVFGEDNASKDRLQSSTVRHVDSADSKGSTCAVWTTQRAVLQPLPLNTTRHVGQRYPDTQRILGNLRQDKNIPTCVQETSQPPSQSPRKLLWPQASSVNSNHPQVIDYATNSLRRGVSRPLHDSRPKSIHRLSALQHTETPCPNAYERTGHVAGKRGPRPIVLADLDPFAGAQQKQHQSRQAQNHRPVVLQEEATDTTPTKSNVPAPIETVPDVRAGPEPLSTPTPSNAASAGAPDVPAPDVPIRSADAALRPSQDPASRVRLGQAHQKIAEVKRLHRWQLLVFRLLFGGIIISANVSLLVLYFFTHHHLYLLAILVFMKSKDLLSTFIGGIGLIIKSVYRMIWPHPEVSQKWILSLISVYAETDDQIWKTVLSLAKQKLSPHKQVICIIVDGKNPQVLSRLTHITHAFKRPYTTWKGGLGELVINAGFIDQAPVIFMRKMQNAGKKDSLILAHDLFNHPRKNMPALTKDFREDLNTSILPQLTQDPAFGGFNGVFCTDADSTVHEHALKKLMDALVQKKTAIAACGILVAELSAPHIEWSIWHLYQQFQYTFGQYVRRQAEGIWGRVSCLPGCITMIAVRPEMGPAIAKYARPVTSLNVFEHQVQYLGTDRRLTWCMLSQSARLTSHLVPSALCETVVPETLEHYLSQRRRWASNAYFNDYFYAFGGEQRLITRLFALIDIVRQTLVFYRVVNTAFFLHSLITRFYILKITPTLVLTKTPAAWFLLLALTTEPVLRKRLHKLLVGMCINQCISPILSVIVFANVLLNVGSQGMMLRFIRWHRTDNGETVWGTTGLSSLETRLDAVISPVQQQLPPGQHTPVPLSEQTWTPRRLGKIVQSAVRGFTSPTGGREGSSRTARNLSGPGSPEYIHQARVPATPGTSSAIFSPTATRKRSPPTARRPQSEM